MTWQDRELVQRYASTMSASHSDVNFIGAWAYDLGGEIELGELHGNLALKLIDYVTHEPIYTFIGRGDANATAAALLEVAATVGAPRLGVVHQDCAALLDRSRFDVVEQRDHADYLCSIDRLAALEGGTYKRLREQIAGFRLKHPQLVSGPLDITARATQAAIIELVAECDREQLVQHAAPAEADEAIGRAHARAALAKLLGAGVRAADFPAIGVFDRDRLVACRVQEVLPGGQAMSHFQAGRHVYLGIHRYVVHEAACALRRCQVSIINEEQDLGIPGLRFFKQALRPIAMTHKFSVTWRES